MEVSANGRKLAIVYLSLVTCAFGLHPKSYGRAFMFTINNLKILNRCPSLLTLSTLKSSKNSAHSAPIHWFTGYPEASRGDMQIRPQWPGEEIYRSWNFSQRLRPFLPEGLLDSVYSTLEVTELVTGA